VATAPTYATGALSSPSDLLTAANQVNDQVNAINDAINGNTSIPQAWWDGFTTFRSSWLAFFSSTFAGQGFQSSSGSDWATRGSWLTSDVASQLQSFETQTASWAQQAASYGAPIAGAIIQPPPDSSPNDLLAGISTTVILLIILVLVVKF
jgi:hypothetical protein